MKVNYKIDIKVLFEKAHYFTMAGIGFLNLLYD